MNQQISFGGQWTQEKLRILSEYLNKYRLIFDKNQRAQFYKVSYVDAFAGTGTIPRRFRDGFSRSLLPEFEFEDEELRKGSARRALEVKPPFHKYVFIEKDTGKLSELSDLCSSFSGIDFRLVNDDANSALLEWCIQLDSYRERAVVFLDPFGASVEWRTIEALAATKAVDLWVLFPCSAINRMLPTNKTPNSKWSDRLTMVFGTDDWKKRFYSFSSVRTLLEQNQEEIRRTSSSAEITNYYVERMRGVFHSVADPGTLYNSKGPLFSLIFAAGNKNGAGAGLSIAKHLLNRLN